METLQLKTGAVQIAIDGDPERVIEFNPEDVVFVELFYNLIRNFEVKEKEFSERFAALEQNSKIGTDGLPDNTRERLAMVREVAEYLKSEIDVVFGAGTSRKVFGDSIVLPLFEQFFQGIIPYVQKSREKKIQKYRR